MCAAGYVAKKAREETGVKGPLGLTAVSAASPLKILSEEDNPLKLAPAGYLQDNT